MSTPAASIHYLVVVLALLLVALLTVPIYWGSSATRELFDNFYYIWAKLKNGDEECKDTEWKRRMHFVLDQLKHGKTLTTRYALYHGLALVLDLLALTLVVLYTLSFDTGLDLGIFSSSSECGGGAFVCGVPNKNLYKWFGGLTTLVLLLKTIVNLKCLLFSLGLPGLFGRNFLIYADQLQDAAGDKIYNVQINPIIVLLQTLGVVLRLLFVAPVKWLVAFCRFYARKVDTAPKEIIKRMSATNIRAEQVKEMKKEKPKEEEKKEEKKVKAAEESDDDHSVVKNGDAKKEKKKPKEEEKPKEEKKEEKEEPKSTPLVPKPAQNWSDLFFIIDSLSYNIDACDLILFMTKINPIPGLENKKVNVDISYLDTTSNTMVVSHTDAGIIEGLLDTELATTGGVEVVGWLEGPTGIIYSQRTRENPKHLAFSVSLGSTYELVSAVYGRGRMLARLQNFTFQCPQDTRKQMKKFGPNVPLSAFISQSLFQKFSSDQPPL